MTDLIIAPSNGAGPVESPPSSSPARPDPLFDAAGHSEVTLPPTISGPRRIFKDRRLMHYNRLAALMALINAAILGYGLTAGAWFTSNEIALTMIANVMVVNFAVAIIMRQQYVINLLFRLATAAPTSWPLRIRWTLGKVYHFGGIHIGGTIAGSLWFTVFLGSIAYHAARGLPGVSSGLLIISGALVVLLVAIIGLALPRFRVKFHDNFEKMHRFGGWAALVLFWAQTLLFVDANRGSTGLGEALTGSLGFWLLVTITVSVALPWLRLRKVPVDIERPSNHVALVRFNYGVTPFAGS